MKKDKNITSYTAVELKARRAGSLSDWQKVDALSDEELENLVAEDESNLQAELDAS